MLESTVDLPGEESGCADEFRLRERAARKCGGHIFGMFLLNIEEMFLRDGHEKVMLLGVHMQQ